MKRLQSLAKSLVFLSLLTLFLVCASSPKNLFAGQKGEDCLITTKVETAFFSERTLRTSFINVSTKGGVVWLTGAVEKAPNVHTAKKIAGDIPGVVKVESMLSVIH